MFKTLLDKWCPKKMLKLKKFLIMCHEVGWVTSLFFALKHFLKINNFASSVVEIREALQWPIYEPATKNKELPRRMKNQVKGNPRSIHWILPQMSASSGGHQTATRMISHLIRKQYQVTIWIQELKSSDPSHLQRDLEKFYGISGCKIYPLSNPDLIEADVLIATDRWTAFPVAAAKKAVKKFYFIQDYESLFYEAGSTSVMIDYTYKLGLHPITAGVWLKKFLRQQHDLVADSFDLACDHDIYNTKFRKMNTTPTVVFYARGNTPRRCVELGLMALADLNRRMPEVHIILFGFDKKGFRVDFPAEKHGLISPLEIAALYSRSTVGLSLSATNHSLIPKEMMACGLPVVELNLTNNTSIYPKGTIIYADPHPTRIADRLSELLLNAEMRELTRKKSLEYVKRLTWERSAETVEKIILRRFKD
ncbi:MAG: glycosyltransferase family 4 protein [Turneriella sp.]|nr:glycosyltransferase family 4 protein [Turneriella sp.]